MASLDSVRQKILRAADHAKSLELELDGYFKTNPGKMVMEPESDPNNPTFTLQAKAPMPARLGMVIGDCLQNLRSSLDYLVWELVQATNHQPTKDHMFPICSTPEAFEYQVSKRNRLSGIHSDAVALIEALQPYHLGQDWEKSVIATLDSLTNINKHRRVLLTLLRGAYAEDMSVIDRNGELWGHGTMPTFDDNAKFGPFPLVGGQVQVNTQLLVSVTFDEGAAKGMEVTQCLNVWMRYVLEDIVPRFERFFHQGDTNGL